MSLNDSLFRRFPFFLRFPLGAAVFTLLLMPPLAFPTTRQATDHETEALWPGATYAPEIPTFEDVLGHAPGERIVSHAEIRRYFDALVAAAPDRVRTFDYARSWEGRDLFYAVLGSAANMARLDAIRDEHVRLAEPRTTSDEDARRLIASTPAITWLAYGVHGNEISSPDASLYTAYHLIASRGDEIVDTILQNSLVMLVPTQNPDGRDRFVNHFRVAEGLVPDAHPIAAEHDEPWPGGRTNHYYFDLNRDWLALTQPETRGHVRAYLSWFPQIFVDLHEMGGNSTYYFAPEADPYNPHITSAQRESLDLYGRNNAKWFDEFGFLYFTREVYDAFYPGYGASWPLFHGSIATTYEQASARGLVFQKSDGTLLRFRDGVRHHFVASIATAETTARNRKRVLESFWLYRKTAVEEGRTEPIRSFVLVKESEGGGGNAAALEKLAGILVEHAIEVQRATEPLRLECSGESREFPAGSYVVDLAQPAKRMARTILDDDVPLASEFVEEQERRRKKNLPDEIYDVTGWSLAKMFGVSSVACGSLPSASDNLETRTTERVTPGSVTAGADVAYLVPWGVSGARFLARALRAELRVLSADREVVQNGRTFPRGTLILPVHDNPPALHDVLSELARESGAEVVATDSGWVDGGVNFGSRNVRHVRPPRIALAWDEPTSSNAAGATRFVLERQFAYPVTPIRVNALVDADLRPFDVLVLPPGGYERAFGDETKTQLLDWVRGGGTLVGVGSAVRYLTSQELLEAKRENQPAREGDPKKEADDGGGEGEPLPAMLLESEADYLAAIEPKTEPPDSVAGVLVRAHADPDHWLTAGVGQGIHALVSGRDIYTPLTLDKGQNPAYFAGADELLASGYLWEENARQLAYKPLVMVQNHGDGVVVGFITDPNFRAYMDGMNVLFMNAVFRGPARARPPVPLGH